MGDYYESSKSNLGFRDTSVPYWCSNVLQAFENGGGPLLLLNWQISFLQRKKVISREKEGPLIAFICTDGDRSWVVIYLYLGLL